MTRPCRCGLTTREVKCADFITEEGEKDLLCDRQCAVLRACGKHECRRICCPLASLAFGKGRKGHPSGIGEEEGGLHECDLLCGKMLACGNHTCDKRDHRGPCPSCLRSTFEEVSIYWSVRGSGVDVLCRFFALVDERYLNRRCPVEPRSIVVISVHVFRPVGTHQCLILATRNHLHVPRVRISQPSSAHVGRRRWGISDAH